VTSAASDAGRVDLHAHTTASDGDLTPSELVVAAAAAGVEVLAITDHDTVAGLEEAAAVGRATGVTFIPGIELTVRVPHGSMHLLGYFPTPRPHPLIERLGELAGFREERIRAIVELLSRIGYPVEWDDVRRRAAGQLGRPHVADALVDAGHAASRDDAFDRWLADGRPAHVPSHGLDPVEAVTLVVASGGAPVLAHPGSLRLPGRHLSSFTQRLAHHGLAGIEVHRPEHTPDQRDTYAAIARRLHLVPAGGSDFHRPGGAFPLGETGTPGLSRESAQRLLGLIGRRESVS
jgi:predicted metal-dependent phosphoesterase TrpH